MRRRAFWWCVKLAFCATTTAPEIHLCGKAFSLADANIDGTTGSLLASTLTATTPRNRRAALALAVALAGAIAALRARRFSR